MNKIDNKGFTLIEALIAMAISAIVVLGVYSMFSAVIDTKDSTEKNNEQNVMLLSLKKVFKNDMLQLYSSSINIDNSGDNAQMSFTTNNSIKLEKSVPVKVTYYIENGWLMRKEENSDMQYEWNLKMLPDVSKFKVLTDKGNEFSDTYKKTDAIFQFSMQYKNDENIKFIAGCGYESQTSLTNSGTTTTTTTEEDDE